MMSLFKKLLKLLGFRKYSDESEGENDSHKKELALIENKKNDEEITVHSCEVIDIEVIDDNLH